MITDYQIIIRLLLAFALGGIIGFEREIHGRVAGLRTHILVCIGACLIMLTSMNIFEIYKGQAQVDPARIAAGVITGIGFLGAGTIIRFKASVRGLTTAASLWVAAAIGLAVGSGFYTGAYTTTGLALASLLLLSKVERRIIKRAWFRVLEVTTSGESEQLKKIRNILSDYSIEIKDMEIKKHPEKEGCVILEVDSKLFTDKFDDQIILNIVKIDGVKSCRWR